MEEEEPEPFEDVGLNDEAKPKKKALFFARFGDAAPHPAGAAGATASPRSSSTHLGFHIPGRKRGHSGSTGAELGTINSATTAAAGDPGAD